MSTACRSRSLPAGSADRTGSYTASAAIAYDSCRSAITRRCTARGDVNLRGHHGLRRAAPPPACRICTEAPCSAGMAAAAAAAAAASCLPQSFAEHPACQARLAAFQRGTVRRGGHGASSCRLLLTPPRPDTVPLIGTRTCSPAATMHVPPRPRPRPPPRHPLLSAAHAVASAAADAASGRRTARPALPRPRGDCCAASVHRILPRQRGDRSRPSSRP